MKRIILYTALFATTLAACNAQDGGSTSENAGEAKEEKKITKRDRSITKANAYNDLFLDSIALENFISQHKVADSISRRMRSFYNARNYQFAWFSSNGLAEQTKGFWNLHDYHTSYRHDTVLHDKQLARTMDALIAEENPRFSASNKNTINTELTLTEHYLQYMLDAYEEGFVKRKEMERFIPIKKETAMYLADSLITKKHKDNKYFENVNQPYNLLKDQMAKYYAIAQKGGWPTVTGTAKSFKKGASSPAIAILKKRLQITGDLPGADTSQVFNDTLALAIRNFQARFGYTPTGTLTDVQIKDLNVPVQKRMEQLVINLERMRWLPHEPEGNLIVVNIPEFKLHVYEGKKKAFDMVVVVGKEGHNTTMFNGDLNQVVFSPYWNVPPSIVKSEILPKLASNPGYLAAQNMEQVGTEGGLPKIRQLPGEGNSLGQVKFLFPNSFNIYFHDTPSKSLFEKDKRAYSHGCIRLAEPEKMAQYLLRNNPEWTSDRIFDAMNAGTEKYVKLKRPVPVVITYYTAWVDEQGRLNFRDDIYSHDKQLAAKMFVGGAAQMAKR
ncbi:MAG: L,D-transpeptidase family protein [Flaviaesturariibacter sp.]|nr:L,D-transpeptidase family protein [Flaviaesturariibacter sp.]